MRVLGVVPARFGSTRFPGKPLTLIHGRPMLQWVLEGAATAQVLDEILVATDHEEIAKLARKLGFRVMMTPSDLPTGSDRVWAAVANERVDVVVNIQGDEPLIQGSVLDALVEPFHEDVHLEMSTMGRALQAGDLESLTTAKVVTNKKGEAIYFSRFPIPYSRLSANQLADACLKHVGLYAYRKEFLQHFCEHSPCSIEMGESLEQLRALYLGGRIRVVRTELDSWGVDRPEDVSKIEAILKQRESRNG